MAYPIRPAASRHEGSPESLAHSFRDVVEPEHGGDAAGRHKNNVHWPTQTTAQCTEAFGRIHQVDLGVDGSGPMGQRGEPVAAACYEGIRGHRVGGGRVQSVPPSL